MLKAVSPEFVTPKKPIFILSGDWAVGKSWFMLDFPKVFYIDTEAGITQPAYIKKLRDSGGMYMGKEQGSQDFDTVIEQVKELATTKHDFQTLCIDSFTKLYNITAAEAEESVGNKYGADKKEAQKPTRQLQLWMDKCDMTIGLVHHSKAEWKNGAPTGVSVFDGYLKMAFELDLWLEMQLLGKNRTMTVRKSRLANFIMGNSYPADYENFSKLFGREIIEKPSVPLVVATQDQLKEINHLIALFNISKEDQAKSLKKYEVESFDELSTEQASKILDALKSKLTKETK